MQLHQMYQWSFETTPEPTTNKVTFKAIARAIHPNVVPLKFPDHDDFVCMCHEWQLCVELLRTQLEEQGLVFKHSVGEINTNLTTGETVLFEDVFTFPEGVDLSSVVGMIQPMLEPLQEAVAHLNQPSPRAVTN
jgi:hypothetical protein